MSTVIRQTPLYSTSRTDYRGSYCPCLPVFRRRSIISFSCVTLRCALNYLPLYPRLITFQGIIECGSIILLAVDLVSAELRYCVYSVQYARAQAESFRIASCTWTRKRVDHKYGLNYGSYLVPG